MRVLVIAGTRREFDQMVQECSAYDRKHNEYTHVTKREQMYGYRPPIGIRFIGTWRDLEDAPSLEDYAKHLEAIHGD